MSAGGLPPPSRRERLLIWLNNWLFPALAGMTAGDCLALLRANRFAVDLRYWPRATLMAFWGPFNSVGRWREERGFGTAVATVRVPPPLFVLGHYRSGTTFLHNLLAVDTRFAYPNFAQVVYPHAFLCSEEATARLLAPFLPRRRPQDNMPLAVVGLPQEDEFALLVTTGCSPYLAWTFPRHADHYERYLTFDGVPADELARWRSAFLHFLRKLTWKYGRPLVLKSPPHTARIRLLLEMWPEARFVHIHRDPLAVFQSTRALAKRIRPVLQLHRSHRGDEDDRILRAYRVMYDAFFRDRPLIRAGQFHEVAYADLERDPVGQVEALYAALNLPDFGVVRPALERYVASLAGYRKNEYAELPAETRARVVEAWGRNFAAWGYPLGDDRPKIADCRLTRGD